MLTFREEIMRNEQKSDGTYNVKIRITYQRKIKRLSTSIFVLKKDLTKDFKLKNPIFIKEVNDLIRNYQEQSAKLQLELNNYSINEIVTFLKEERERSKTIDFIQFSKDWLEYTEIKGKKNYKSAINAFITFLGDRKSVV